MNTFTAESSHTVAYSWSIKAPAELNADDIEALVKALVDWTDAPDNAALEDMLKDEYALDDLDKDKMEYFKQVTIYCDSVARDSFAQSIQQIKE